MQRLRDSLIRIVKGPTGGFLASLGIAAVLGGVALASPAPPIADGTGHHAEVVAADPLGPYPTSTSAVASGVSTMTGGVRSDADPTGRGPALDPTQNGRAAPGANTSDGSGSSGGGVRSAGLAPAHQDARDDPTTGGSTHHQGPGGQQGSGSGSGQQGSGSGQSGQGSGGQQGDKGTGSGSGDSGSGNSGSGGAGSAGSGSGSTGSSDRGDGGGSGTGGSGVGGSGSGGSGADHGGDNTPDAHSAR